MCAIGGISLGSLVGRRTWNGHETEM